MNAVVVEDRFRHRLAADLPAGAGVELGVYRGEFSRVALDRTPGLTVLTLIDRWAPGDPDFLGREDRHEPAYARVLATVARDPRVVVRRGEGRAVLATLPPSSVAWAYLDATHSREEVLADLIALDRVATDVIAGHYYEDRDGRRGEWVRRTGCGVVDAVADFTARGGWRLARVYRDAARMDSFTLTREAT